jgi:hypothetical protein
MQNNKFIFQEQQKIAIKLCNALELSLEQFQELNIKTNNKLRDAFAKNPKFKYNPVLPKPDIIYEKEFHFLDETLLKMEQRRVQQVLAEQPTQVEESKEEEVKKQFVLPNSTVPI